MLFLEGEVTMVKHPIDILIESKIKLAQEKEDYLEELVLGE